jgi:acyl carrier protein
MDYQDILQRILELARSRFEAGGSAIEEASTASDVPAWNSLSHVMLVAEIEGSFGIKFDLMKMVEMKSIGDLARATHEALS